MADATRTISVEAEFTGLTVRPGDTLLVRYSRAVSMENAERLKAKLKERLPGVDVLIVEADGLAVYRPDQV